jgi:hypothetical protein
MAKLRHNCDGLVAANDQEQYAFMTRRSIKKSTRSKKLASSKNKVSSSPVGLAKTRNSSSTSKGPNRDAEEKEKRPPSKPTSVKLIRPRTSKQYFTLPEIQKDRWENATHVVSKMRSENISLTKAAREYGLTPKAVLARAGSALRKTKSGRYVARPSDKLLRVLKLPGQIEVAVRDSATASKIAEYWDAVDKFVGTGDSSKLKKFRRLKLLDEKGKRIKLLTDLAELQTMGSAGVLSFESLYARTTQ